MWYSIYKNIDKTEFYFLKQKIEMIEQLITPIMQLYNFYMNRDSQFREVLGLDYHGVTEEMKGNIGFSYEEEVSNHEKRQFKFYVLKSYDAGAQRFYKRASLEKMYTLDEIEQDSILDRKSVV